MCLSAVRPDSARYVIHFAIRLRTNEPSLRLPVAAALFNKGTIVGALSPNRRAIRIYDQLIESYGTNVELPLPDPLARALVNRMLILAASGRADQAMSAYDDLVARFGESVELPERQRIANDIVGKGIRLCNLTESMKAAEICRMILSSLAEDSDLEETNICIRRVLLPC